MAETLPKRLDDPSHVWIIQTTKEMVKRSRELLEETKPLVERQQHWPMVRDKETKPPQAN